jgi:predicted transcriptional regulator
MNTKRAITVSLRVTDAQKEQLDRIAKSERRRVGDLLYIWVEDALQRRLEAEAAKPGDKA